MSNDNKKLYCIDGFQLPEEVSDLADRRSRLREQKSVRIRSISSNRGRQHIQHEILTHMRSTSRRLGSAMSRTGGEADFAVSQELDAQLHDLSMEI